MKKDRLEEKTIIAEKELARAEKKYLPDDYRLVNPMRRLGKLYYLKGRQPEAIAMLQRALAITDVSGQGEPSETIDLLNVLSVALSAGGRFLESLPLMLRCLALREKELGPGHPNLTMQLNNVATIYANINALDRAADAMSRALAIADEGLDDDDPFWLKLWINMSGLCQFRKQPDEAEAWLQKVLGFKGLKPDDPVRSVALNNLGEIAMGQGRFDEARELLQQALDIKQRQLGYDHPDVMINLINLGELHGKSGDARQAESQFLEAIRIGEQRLGPDHHMVGLARYRYGSSLFARGFGSSARENLVAALEILSRALGPGHPLTAEVQAKLGEFCQDGGELAGARGHYNAALEALLACYGPDRPEVAQLRERIARLEEAEQPSWRRKGPA